jgi:hypothetical protein
MAVGSTRFWCPNCFMVLEKDDGILMLMGNVRVVGDGISWAGDVERGRDKIKRVKYCTRCNKPLDFHALLQNKLDYRDYASPAAVCGFLAGGAVCLVVLQWGGWPSFAAAAAAGVAAALAVNQIQRRRVSRWGLSEAQAEELRKGPRQ